MKIIDQVPSELLNAVNEFSRKLEWARRLPIYEIHKWWARRYSGIIRIFLAFTELDYKCLDKVDDFSSFVEKIYFYPPKVQRKKLLDPFCGGGTIIIEASNLGYEAHGIEINKLAYLMLKTLKFLPSTDIDFIERKISKIADSVSQIWTTKCLRGHSATIIHTFLAWKNKDGLPQIKFNKIKDGDEKLYYCERCNKLFRSNKDLKSCEKCGNSFQKNLQKIEYSDLWPFAIEYFCPYCNERNFKLATPYDRRRFYLQIEKKLFPIPWLNETARLLKAGFNDFAELLTPRQLFTFTKILNSFRSEPYRTIIKLLVSDSLRCCSLLAYYSSRYMKVIPGFVIKSYWLPPQPVELNPLSFYISKNGRICPLGRGNIISGLRKIKKAKEFIQRKQLKMNFKLYYGPAQDILKKLKGKYDIIFTDPPYGDYQFYSDLSLFSLSVIHEINSQSLKTLLEKEIILRNRNYLNRYRKGLKQVFSLALQRLSNKGRILLTFHHTNFNLIFNIIDIFKNLNLNLHAIYPVIGESSGKLTKRKIYLDLLFVFGQERKSPYFAYTKCNFTKYDAQLQNLAKKLIDFYEDS